MCFCCLTCIIFLSAERSQEFQILCPIGSKPFHIPYDLKIPGKFCQQFPLCNRLIFGEPYNSHKNRREKLYIKKKKALLIMGSYIASLCLYCFSWDLIPHMFLSNRRGEDGMKYASCSVRDLTYGRLGIVVISHAACRGSRHSPGTGRHSGAPSL